MAVRSDSEVVQIPTDMAVAIGAMGTDIEHLKGDMAKISRSIEEQAKTAEGLRAVQASNTERFIRIEEDLKKGNERFDNIDASLTKINEHFSSKPGVLDKAAKDGFQGAMVLLVKLIVLGIVLTGLAAGMQFLGVAD